MKDNFEYRAEARASLDSNIFSNTWLMMLIVFLIGGALLSVGTAAGFGIVGWILTGPVMFGEAFVMLGLIRGNKSINISELFNGFLNDIGSRIVLGIMQSLFIFLWSLLFVIPGIVKAYGYSMAYFISVDHPEMDWRACLSESERLMTGKKMKLFLLDLSFIGWIILGALAFGIGTLWVIPYQSTARACFYEDVKNTQVN